MVVSGIYVSRWQLWQRIGKYVSRWQLYKKVGDMEENERYGKEW